MRELPKLQNNLNHAIKFCWWRHRQYYDAITFILKNVILRIPGIAIFADITKIITIFIETFLKTQKELKELDIIYQNAIYICIFFYNKSFDFRSKNADFNRTQWFICFLDLL